MRARPKTTTRRLRPLRRPHSASTRPAPPEADPHPDERRARESGGPLDKALYTCTCGFVFDADVSTSVTCPHCGAGQAW
jgi:hypothetical protein